MRFFCWHRAPISVAAGVSIVLACAGLSAFVCGVWAAGTSTSLPVPPAGLCICGLVLLSLAAPAPYSLITKAHRQKGSTRPRKGFLPYHSYHLAEVLAETHASDAPTKAGLSSAAASQRLTRVGPNTIRRKPPPSATDTLMREIQEPTLVLLQVIGMTYSLIGDLSEALLALGINCLLIGTEVATEHRAARALESLRSSAPQSARVLRDGASQDVPLHDVVPGDTVILRAGFTVPADARLLTSSQLEVDESRLTGESLVSALPWPAISAHRGGRETCVERHHAGK